MTTLVVDELVSQLVQPIYIKKKIKALAVKLHLYVHNMPTGSFKFQILKEGDLYAEFPFSCDDLKSSFGGTTSYFRVFFPFAVGSKINFEEGNYTLKITSTGYTYSQTSFLGWCKDWQGYFGDVTIVPESYLEFPYSFRIIELRPREF